MKIRDKNGSCHVVELEHNDQVQLLVPASMERTCVLLEVYSNGKLSITGGSDVIEEIGGEGMEAKVKNRPGLGHVVNLESIISELSSLKEIGEQTPPAQLLEILPSKEHLRQLEKLVGDLLYLHQWQEGVKLTEKYRKKE